MIKATSGLTHTMEFIDKVQEKVTGDFNPALSRAIAIQLSDEGFVYNPELSFEPNGRIFEIVAEVEERVTSDGFGFIARLARAITQELSFEGVHKP